MRKHAGKHGKAKEYELTLCVRTDADGLAVGGAYLVVVNHRCSMYGCNQACDKGKEEEEQQSPQQKGGPHLSAHVFRREMVKIMKMVIGQLSQPNHTVTARLPLGHCGDWATVVTVVTVRVTRRVRMDVFRDRGWGRDGSDRMRMRVSRVEHRLCRVKHRLRWVKMDRMAEGLLRVGHEKSG